MQLEAVVPLRAVGALVGEIPPAACRRRIPAALAGDRHGATAQREPARLRKQVASPCLRASAPAVASYSLAARLRNAFFWWGGQWTLFSRCCVRVGLPRALAVSFHSVAQWEGRGVCRARRSGPRVSGGRGYLPTWVGLGWVLGLG